VINTEDQLIFLGAVNEASTAVITENSCIVASTAVQGNWDQVWPWAVSNSECNVETNQQWVVVARDTNFCTHSS
jgi:hypothetical protein